MLFRSFLLMAKYYNKHHTPQPSFNVGDLVWLLRRNIKTTRPSDKLDYRRLGPFKILDQRGKSSFLLKLPPTLSRLHPVFHVSLLEPFVDPDTIPDRITSQTNPTASVELLDEPPNRISTIIDSRKVGRRYDYFVHWKDSVDTENSWVPFSEIPNNLFHVLDQFHRRNPSRPHPPRFHFSITPANTPSSFANFPLLQANNNHYPSTTRSPSPPPDTQPRDYQPPIQQKTRSGRLVHPPPSKEYTTSTLKKGVV